MNKSVVAFAGLALLATTAFGGQGDVRRSTRRIPGSYIVVLDAAADTASVEYTVRNLPGARLKHTYRRGVKGLAVELSDSDARHLARDSRVAFIEEDSTISAASWGLDRIDQRSLPLNGSFVSNESGSGVTVYVVDTGILAEHSEFGGRVTGGFTAFVDGTSDCNGHGTHVAGIIGGTTYGVAKSANLVPVRVLDCNGGGTLSTLLAGLDWILDEHARSPKPSVVNMSLGGDASSALDEQVNKLIAAGLTTVVAAGNNNQDACRTSPARVPGVITVGATDESDQRAAFSNYGPCVDLFAPGLNVVSASHASATGTATGNGTSAAAPFAAGVAALWLEKFPLASGGAIVQTVVANATVDVLSSIGQESSNRLLFSQTATLEDAVQADSQLLADPGFEYGTTFWSSDVCTVVNPTGCGGYRDIEGGGEEFNLYNYPSRSGNNRAAIGGPARSFNLMSEIVTVPATIRRAELSLYLWVVTKNHKPTKADVLNVEIRDANGNLLETVGVFSNLDESPTYVLKRFDVTRYRGATIRVSFTGVQSQGPPTWFLLDDAALKIWR